MKKLFILLLVLCMASLAGATTVSFVDEGHIIGATPGEVVRLEVMSDAGLYGLNAVATVTSPTHNSDVFVDAVGSHEVIILSSYGWDPDFSFPPIGLGTSQAEIGLGNFMGNYNTIVGYFDVLYTSGIQYVSIGPGTIYGGSSDINFEPPEFSTGVVTIIPEPATLALLGLGALAILRRRK